MMTSPKAAISQLFGIAIGHQILHAVNIDQIDLEAVQCAANDAIHAFVLIPVAQFYFAIFKTHRKDELHKDLMV